MYKKYFFNTKSLKKTTSSENTIITKRQRHFYASISKAEINFHNCLVLLPHMGRQVSFPGKLPTALFTLEILAPPVAPKMMGARLQVVQELVGFFSASSALGAVQA